MNVEQAELILSSTPPWPTSQYDVEEAQRVLVRDQQERGLAARKAKQHEFLEWIIPQVT